MDTSGAVHVRESGNWSSIGSHVAEPRPPYRSGRVKDGSHHTFSHLVSLIQQTHHALLERAARAVNVSLTLRNWLIGFHIAEFELRGADRAVYGKNLLAELASALRRKGVVSAGHRQLYGYLAFYRTYPQIGLALVDSSVDLPGQRALRQKLRTLSAKLPDSLSVDPKQLINQLSYSHFEELVELQDALKRSFYEIESVRGNWSVRTLKRQIATLYFERSGMTVNKETLSQADSCRRRGSKRRPSDSRPIHV